MLHVPYSFDCEDTTVNWELVENGFTLLQYFDNKFKTKKNINCIKHILKDCFQITQDKLCNISIEISENKVLFLSFGLFKIYVEVVEWD